MSSTSSEAARARWPEALRASLPVGLGYLPTGFAFGVLALQAGLPLWLALLLSVFVYAGALQFAAIPLLASGAGLGALGVTAFLVNLRHILYALPLLRSLPRARAARAYALAALTDETYSLVTAMPSERRAALLVPVAFVNQAWWVLGTLAGAVLGPAVAAYVPNLDFALPCLFLILALEQYRTCRAWQPIAVAVVCLAAARWLLPQAHVLAGTLLMALAWLGTQAWYETRRAAGASGQA